MAEHECKIAELGDPVHELKAIQAQLNIYYADNWRLITVTPAKYGICGIFEREVASEQETASLQLIDIMAALEAEDRLLRQLITGASQSGEWDGGFEQLVEIADGSRKVAGIGPKRQRQLAELVKTA